MAADGGTRSPGGRTWLRAEAWRFLELLGLCGLVVAQPLFDALQRDASLFLLWGTSGVQVVAFAALVVLVPPLLLWVVGAALGLVVPRARPWVHAASLGLVAGALTIEVLKPRTTGTTALLLTAATAVGIGMAAVVLRWSLVRTWLRFLALAPVALALVFVLASPVTPIVQGSDAGALDVRVGAPHRVVWLVLDELSLTALLDGNGRIDPELYPSFARLAGQATWYRNTTTVAPDTTAALPAILTGRIPKSSTAVPALGNYPDNLFTTLGGSYDLNVHESVTRMCPGDACALTRRPLGVHAGFRGMLTDVADLWRSKVSPSRASAAFDLRGLGSYDYAPLRTVDRFVRSLRPASGPRLDFLHVLVPHFPWRYLPTGQDYTSFPADPAGLDGTRWQTPWMATLYQQRDRLQTQAADLALGRVMDRLQAIGAWDDTLFVVTADHGIAFESGLPMRGVAQQTYPEIMWVPLLVKQPGQNTGALDDRPALSVDILPTTLDALKARAPFAMDGRSLLAAPRREGRRPLLDWADNVVKPARGRLLQLDGAAGFADVLTRQAAPPGAPAWQRPYRIGPYGALVGRPAAPLTDPTASRIPARLDQAERYARVDSLSPRVPFSDVHATVGTRRTGVSIAVVVNGTIAAVLQTAVPEGGRTQAWGIVPPPFFRFGANDVRLAEVVGSPAAPRLRPTPPLAAAVSR